MFHIPAMRCLTQIKQKSCYTPVGRRRLRIPINERKYLF